MAAWGEGMRVARAVPWGLIGFAGVGVSGDCAGRSARMEWRVAGGDCGGGARVGYI